MPAHRNPIRPWIAGAALLIAALLACARADVPMPTADAPTDPPGIPTLNSTATRAPRPSVTATTAPPPSSTPTPLLPPPSPTFPATPTAGVSAVPEMILYPAQSGDTLRAVAVRFGVLPSDIQSTPDAVSEPGLIDPGQLLFIPRRLDSVGPSQRLLPDSELIFSPNASDFDAAALAAEQGGYLSRYTEYVGARQRTGAEVVALVARDNAVNPRLLLALLEYQAGWVTRSARPGGDALRYPMGHREPLAAGLYRQLTWAANELGNGYYGWRAGTLTELSFRDGTRLRMAPDLNAGTAALQHYFSVLRDPAGWRADLEPAGWISTYRRLFGDPWTYEFPIFEPGVEQPDLTLPFLPGHIWSFSGGPHGAWERESAWAAIDFAPSVAEPGCSVSEDWAVASAPGQVVRSENGVVALDLDGDGREQTGWVLIYLHLADRGRVAEGEFVEEGDLLGHPSCEGGVATGSHVHLVRKYNGEWILADGPLPFTLGGWTVHAGTQPYEGFLTRDSETVIACPCGSFETFLTR